MRLGRFGSDRKPSIHSEVSERTESPIPSLLSRGSNLIKKKTSMLVDLRRRLSRANNEKQKWKKWLVPSENDVVNEGRYVLRSSDLLYLRAPSHQLYLTFSKQLNEENILQGLERAIATYPLVAGELKVLKPDLHDSNDDFGFGNESLESLAQVPIPRKLHIVVDCEKREGKGVLFEYHDIPDDKYFDHVAPSHLFNHQTSKKTLLSVRLSVGCEKSVIAVTCSHVLADCHSLGKFMQCWAVYTNELVTPLQQSQLEHPHLDRDLELEFSDYMDLEKRSLTPVKTTLEDQGKSVMSKLETSIRHRSAQSVEIDTSYLELLREEFMQVFTNATFKMANDTSLFDLCRVSDYELMTGIGVCFWRLVKESETAELFNGYFAINLRGRMKSMPFGYFGNAYAFPSFSFKLSENNTAFRKRKLKYLTPLLYNSILGVARCYHACSSNRNKLLEMEKTYEALFSKEQPLNRLSVKKAKNASYQKPLIDFQTGKTPAFLFSTAQDFELPELEFQDFPVDKTEVLSNTLLHNAVVFFKSAKDKVVLRMVLDGVQKKKWVAAKNTMQL